jgi:hypothetical protein
MYKNYAENFKREVIMEKAFLFVLFLVGFFFATIDEKGREITQDILSRVPYAKEFIWSVIGFFVLKSIPDMLKYKRMKRKYISIDGNMTEEQRKKIMANLKIKEEYHQILLEEKSSYETLKLTINLQDSYQKDLLLRHEEMTKELNKTRELLSKIENKLTLTPDEINQVNELLTENPYHRLVRQLKTF